MRELSVQRLREALAYDPATGVFTWQQPTNRRISVGSIAGTAHPKGYLQFSIDGVRCLAHRAAVAYVAGDWPTHEVDHKDGNKTNNRYSNLRSVSHAINQENLRSAKRSNLAGFLGVSLHGSRFRATIHANGKRIRLGCFDTPEQAHQAYLRAKRKLHAGCTI